MIESIILFVWQQKWIALAQRTGKDRIHQFRNIIRDEMRWSMKADTWGRSSEEVLYFLLRLCTRKAWRVWRTTAFQWVYWTWRASTMYHRWDQHVVSLSGTVFRDARGILLSHITILAVYLQGSSRGTTVQINHGGITDGGRRVAGKYNTFSKM